MILFNKYILLFIKEDKKQDLLDTSLSNITLMFGSVSLRLVINFKLLSNLDYFLFQFFETSSN